MRDSLNTHLAPKREIGYLHCGPYLYLRFFRNGRRLTPIRNDEFNRVESERDFYKNEAEKYKIEVEYYKQETIRLTNELQQLKQIKEIPEHEDRFNVNDLFSRLPDLCIDEIFKRLLRKDIFNMSMVSTRFFPLTNERSLDGIKWEKGSLAFYKSANGYHFRLKVDRLNRPNSYEYDIKYDYGIIMNEDGEVMEKKSNGPYNEDYEVDIETCRNSVHSWPVPHNFLLNLAHLLRQRNVSFLSFFAFPYDAEFFSNLSMILKGHTVDYISVNYPILNEPISEQGRLSFANFIKGMRKVEIDSSQFLINEQFLRDIKGEKLVYFDSGFDGDEDDDIMAIDSLDQTTKKMCTFVFAIDGEITGDEISLQLRPNYEYSVVNNGYVIKRVDGRIAKIEIINYELTQSGNLVHGISVKVEDED